MCGRESLVLPQMVAESTRRGSVRLDKRHLPPSRQTMTSKRRFGHVSQSGPPLSLPPFHSIFVQKVLRPSVRPSVPPSPSSTVPFFVRRFRSPGSLLRSPLIPPSLNITRNPPSLLLLSLWFLRSVRRLGRGGRERGRAAAC